MNEFVIDGKRCQLGEAETAVDALAVNVAASGGASA
jgi:hypothetical protein